MIEFIEASSSMSQKAASSFSIHNAGYEACARGYAYGPRICPYHIFHFVYKGQGTLCIGGKTYPVHRGEAFLIPAEKIASYQASETDPWSYAWIGYLGTEADQFTERYFQLLGEKYVIEGLDADRYLEIIQEVAHFEGNSNRNFFLANAALYRLFGELVSQLDEGKGSLHPFSIEQKVRYFIEMRYCEKLRLKDIADSFGIHPNYLSSAFKKAYGITPKQFLTKCRLDKACSLLGTTALPISLIAESLGFEDQMSFSRSFRQAYGKTPTAYRQECQAATVSAPQETLDDYVRYV